MSPGPFKYLIIYGKLWSIDSLVFHHDNADGNTDSCCSMDNPVVLFGVYYFPHQYH